MVRLKIENTNFPVIKSKRINDHFMTRVANPTDFLQFYKKAGFMASLNINKTLIGKMKQSASSLLGDLQDGDIINGSGISGLDVDENKFLIDKLIRKQIKETCSLNLVSAGKMAQVIDKYVQHNDTHLLETFFDHEVFRKSYHEVRRSLIETSAHSKYAVHDQLEEQMRDKVKSFLNFQFGDADECLEEPQGEEIDQAKASY